MFVKWGNGPRRGARVGMVRRLPYEGMGCLIAVLLLAALVFFGVGFVAHVLWIFAAIFFAFWLAGYGFAKGRRRAERHRYR